LIIWEMRDFHQIHNIKSLSRTGRGRPARPLNRRMRKKDLYVQEKPKKGETPSLPEPWAWFDGILSH